MKDNKPKNTFYIEIEPCGYFKERKNTYLRTFTFETEYDLDNFCEYFKQETFYEGKFFQTYEEALEYSTEKLLNKYNIGDNKDNITVIRALSNILQCNINELEEFYDKINFHKW